MIKVGNAGRILCELEEIAGLLEDPKSGLAEIKSEVRNIEERVATLSTGKGPLTTGPLYIPSQGTSAISVVVQNLDRCPANVEVRVLSLECCPPVQVCSADLRCIGRCCSESVTLTATEGLYEVVCCPDPEKASIRAFVSVHEGSSPSSPVAYAVTAAEMLPLECPFCKKEKCRPCRDLE